MNGVVGQIYKYILILLWKLNGISSEISLAWYCELWVGLPGIMSSTIFRDFTVITVIANCVPQPSLVILYRSEAEVWGSGVRFQTNLPSQCNIPHYFHFFGPSVKKVTDLKSFIFSCESAQLYFMFRLYWTCFVVAWLHWFAICMIYFHCDHLFDL